jgi:hypothetical protein
MQLSDSKKNLFLGHRWAFLTKIEWPTYCRSEYKFDFDFSEIPAYKTENTVVGIRYADHVASSILKFTKQSLRRQAAVARSVQFARGLRPRSF